MIRNDPMWKEQVLLGQSFTPNQLFWISYAQSNCEKARSGARRTQMQIDTHAPGEFRVKGTLSNNKDFANDFQCPKGSLMNPLQKCKIW